MKKCQAKTKAGKKCSHTAKYPLANPRFCGHHKNQKEGESIKDNE